MLEMVYKQPRFTVNNFKAIEHRYKCIVDNLPLFRIHEPPYMCQTCILVQNGLIMGIGPNSAYICAAVLHNFQQNVSDMSTYAHVSS